MKINKTESNKRYAQKLTAVKAVAAAIIATLIVHPLSIHAAEYTVKGERWLRMYTAERATPVYNARIDATRIVNNFCNVPWTKTSVESAHETSHTTTNLDANVANREAFDAALFCAHHENSMHVAYANASCYRIDLGDGSLPKLTSLAVNVYSDPYNAGGARIVLMTNDSGKIPTDCATVRGDVTGGIKATNVARRITVTSSGKDYWYPNSTNLVFSTQQLGASGIQLHRYLYVFVLLEDYGATRGDWLEGSSFIDNEIKITTSASIPSMSGGCDIAEPYATTYHLKDGRAGDDDDGDGLSNYAEYLITEVFKFATLSPDNPKSDGTTPDFFRKVGECYLGEIFNQRNDKYAFDPKIRAKIVYHGSANVDLLTIKCWRHFGSGKPDAIWRVSKKDAVNSAFDEMTFNLGKPDVGMVREGKNTFTVNAGTDYTAGVPYGFVRGVNVGWDSAAFELEVTDTSAVFARVDITGGGNDRDVKWGSASGNVDTEEYMERLSNSVYHTEIPADAQLGTVNHVRIIPYLVAGTAMDTALTEDDRTYAEVVVAVTNRVIAEFDVDTQNRPFITEADFIKNGEYDIQWNDFATFKSEIDNNEYMDIGDITAIKYRIIIGNGGRIGAESNLDDTKPVVSAFSTLIERRFEPTSSRTKPTGLQLTAGSVVYGGRPTFTWRLDETANVSGFAPSAAIYGCTYTAFQLQVADANNTVVYDSGLQRTPAKDAEGRFVWTAPLVAGQQTDLAQIFAKAGNWKWRVAMYNAKFKPTTREARNGWSTLWTDAACATFSTAVGQQQTTDDHGYGSVNVAVKYVGPTAVLADVTNTTKKVGKVRVQAFTTPDFSGEPEAETILTDKVALTNAYDITANVRLDGLKNGATYYVRAYIDSDGDLKKADWESWGEAKAGVEIDANKAAETVAVWIEDVDTDDDWLPDAMEIASYGSLTNFGMSVKSDGIISLKTSTYNAMTSGTANISKNMSGASLTFMQNLSTTPTLLGYGQGVTTNTLSNIRALIDNNINED